MCCSKLDRDQRLSAPACFRGPCLIMRGSCRLLRAAVHLQKGMRDTPLANAKGWQWRLAMGEKAHIAVQLAILAAKIARFDIAHERYVTPFCFLFTAPGIALPDAGFCVPGRGHIVVS
eukprot:jgi/Chlat1/9060/Chrsp94S08356